MRSFHTLVIKLLVTGIVEGAEEDETAAASTTTTSTSPAQLESEDIVKISCNLCSKTFISKMSYEVNDAYPFEFL